MAGPRVRGDGVINLFRSRRPQQPFLSPLGRQRRMPSLAAPLVLSVCGGVVLVLAVALNHVLTKDRLAA